MFATHALPLHRPFALLLTAALVLGLAMPLVAPARVGAASADLFFSEYVEGSSNNKALEIYNGTGASVDLGAAGYNIQQFSNGNSTAGLTINLSGTVADGDVFVLAHASAAADVLAVADQTSSAGLFNGDDALVLRKGTTVLDVIGQVGFDPGDEWGSGLTSTLDNTLRRKPTVTDGDPIGNDAFDPSVEWDGFATNTFNGLGSHTVSDVPVRTDPSGTGAADPASVMVGATTLLTVTVTPGTNPDSTELAVTADLGPIGGSATQAFFDDGANGDATAGDNVFTWLATVGAVEAGGKVITATITDAEERSGTATISLTVAGAPSTIPEIQGESHLSPLDGEQVFGVEGIVTVSRSSSFWMTDPVGDGNDATSDGILVFGATAPVGAHVRVDGTVDEFRPGGSGGFENLTTTEIVSPTVTVLSTGNELPTTIIGVDRLPPTLAIDDDSTTSVEASNAVYDPENDGIDFWESLEGMRLLVADAVAVGPRNSFGEIAVISQLQADAGLRTPRGGILVRDPERDGNYQPADFNPERVILDDALAATPMVNTGDEFLADPVGVLDYGFGNYKLLVTANPGRVDNGLTREVTTPQGPRDLAVATFNVENLSVVNDQAKFDELAGQIVNNLRAPDLIGIEEMQDDSGPANDGTVSADAGWARLIDAIVAAGGPEYEFRSIDPVNNADGGAPGANIRVGFLFRTDRGLEFVDRPGGDAVTDTDVVPTPNGKWAQLTVSPGRVLDAELGGDDAFFDTRKSLAGEFRWRGETLFLVVNHFSSKGDDRPLFGHFQPPFRLTEFESGEPEDGWRHAQAQAVNDFVDEILAVDEDANVIVLGDINDFDFSETVQILSGERVAVPGGADADGSGPTTLTGEDPILTSLFELLPENERYSYVFDGNSQVLDQILVSGSILSRDPTYDVVRVNAEFAVQTSDHDPSVMRVAFQPRRR
ncbi:MAG TPA: lamin tail domain-containing protein [Candidatus Limnocylindria bacterium]|nr:lamin tail domain-containing protein [Candidatus Limnocylindria bacterium]